MKIRANEEQILVAYLLGEASEQECQKIEEQYFRDQSYHEQLLVLEDELIQQYVRGELPPRERNLFENRFLNSARRTRKLQFAHRLIAYVDELSPTHSQQVRHLAQPARLTIFERCRNWLEAVTAPQRWAIGALATVGLVFLAYGVVSLFFSMRPSRDLAILETPPSPVASPVVSPNVPVKEQKPNQPSLPGTKKTIVEPKTYALALTLPTVRTGEPGQIVPVTIPQGITQVKLQVALPDDVAYTDYVVTLKTHEAGRIWQGTNLKRRSASPKANFCFSVPASLFKKGADYVLDIKGSPGTVDQMVGEIFLHINK